MNLIVAADKKWGIGRGGGLLADLPGDMKFFRETTSGKVVVMGRKTLETLPGAKGLPNRINYVVTRNPKFKAKNCSVVHSEDELWEALSMHLDDDVLIIGGAEIYNRFYKSCDRLYVTKIDADLDADTFITNFDEDPDFEVVLESEPLTDNGITYRFTTYEKKK